MMSWEHTAADQLTSSGATLVTRVLVPICGCGCNLDSKQDPIWYVFKIDEHLHLQCPACGVTFCQQEPKCGLQVEI